MGRVKTSRIRRRTNRTSEEAERQALASFSKAVLIDFIQESAVFSPDNMIERLVAIERCHQMKTLQEKAEHLIAKMKTLGGIENVNEYLATDDELSRVWKKLDELAAIIRGDRSTKK